MKKIILIIPIFFAITFAFGQNTTNGVYVGLEEMCWTDSLGKKDCYNDPVQPKWKWYHLSYLKIKGDSVFLDQSPISIYKKDTSFSSSDGAFYYYSGTVLKIDSVLDIKLTQLFCDYCGLPKKRDDDGNLVQLHRTKQYLAKLTKKGFIINGFLFTKTTEKMILRSEQPKSH